MADLNPNQIDIDFPRRLDIPKPDRIGPSVFPNAVDQLKLINYSSVPAGGQIEQDLKNYYMLLSNVASNQATEEELLSLKALMVRIREYVVTEDDFNLMADAVRTTQEYMLNAIQQESNNFNAITQVASQFMEEVNNWTVAFEQDLIDAQAAGTALGAPVVFSSQQPQSPAGGFGYLWIDTNIDEDFVAPAMSWDPDLVLGDSDILGNS